MFFDASSFQRLGKSCAHLMLPRLPGSSAFLMMVLPLPAQSRFVRTLRQPYHQRVIGQRAFDVERAGLRVTAPRPGLAGLVTASGVDGPCADSVAGMNPQHRLDAGREVLVKLLRLEVMRPRRGRARLDAYRRPLDHTVRKDDVPFQLTSLERTLHLGVLEGELDGVAFHRSLDGAAAQGPGQRVAIDGEHQSTDVGSERIVQRDHPLAGNAPLRCEGEASNCGEGCGAEDGPHGRDDI